MMASDIEERGRDDAPAPVLEPGYTYGTVTDKISAIVLRRPYEWHWMGGIAISFALMMVLVVAFAQVLFCGVGVWGINRPIGWAFAIVTFVWWVGLGHAGTLISAI